jgi:hypothetical protein
VNTGSQILSIVLLLIVVYFIGSEFVGKPYLKMVAKMIVPDGSTPTGAEISAGIDEITEDAVQFKPPVIYPGAGLLN